MICPRICARKTFAILKNIDLTSEMMQTGSLFWVMASSWLQWQRVTTYQNWFLEAQMYGVVFKPFSRLDSIFKWLWFLTAYNLSCNLNEKMQILRVLHLNILLLGQELKKRCLLLFFITSHIFDQQNVFFFCWGFITFLNRPNVIHKTLMDLYVFLK